MKRLTTHLMALSVVAGLALPLLPIESSAQEQSQKDQWLSTATPPLTIAQRGEARETMTEGNHPARQKAVVERPAYVPPHRGAPSPSRRFGGGTRGGIAAPPAILALAPTDHTALTLQEQPTLYWYASSEITTHVEVALTDETDKNDIRTVVEASLAPPLRAGIHSIRLADYDKVRLVPGKRYRWSVALVFDPDRRSKDILTYGWIQRVEKADKLSVWYDAVMAISEQIDAMPANRDLRRQRAALLDQAELTDVASYDKALGKQGRE